MARLCIEPLCLNPAYRNKRRCVECEEAHRARTGQASLNTESCRESQRRIREQLAILAARDPFYARN